MFYLHPRPSLVARSCSALGMMLWAAALTTAAFGADAPDPRETALRTAELARFEANVRADAKVLQELLDDELEYVHSNGELDSKKSFIDSLVTGRRDYAATVPTIENIRILGDVAIIRGKADVTVIDQGTSRDLHIGYTDVWLWKDGRWRMTAWRSARLPAPGAKP
jgi:hypothetical protein